jgi:hypothetical protein
LKIGASLKPHLLLLKYFETWKIGSYHLKVTSEPITTTIGSKPRTFQNSNEFWPNSPIFLLLFSFLFLSLQDRPGDTLAGHPSLFLSLMLFVPCKWTLGREAPEANLAQRSPLSLSHPLHPAPPISATPPTRRDPSTPPASACSS